jgi:long-subunit acyl-CoA synthetase (AMP-forming)
MFAITAAKGPHKEAVVSCWQPSGIKPPHANLDADSKVPSAYVRWSYGDIIQRVESLAIWPQSQGCTVGKNVVLFVWDPAEWALFFWVAAKLRMPFVPLDPRVSGSAARDYIEMTDPYVLVVQDDALVLNLDTISQIVPIRISCGDNRGKASCHCQISSHFHLSLVRRRSRSNLQPRPGMSSHSYYSQAAQHLPQRLVLIPPATFGLQLPTMTQTLAACE